MSNSDARAAAGTDDEEDSHLVKVVFVGDSGVGKTCLLGRLFSDRYDEQTQATIGCDFKFKRYKVDNKSVGVTLWDTAGAEKFQAVTSNYYRGAQGFIFVYDVTRRETLDSLQNYWLGEVQHHLTYPDAVKMIIANKIDKMEERQVSTEEGQEFARNHNCNYQECSAKTDINVYDAMVWGVLCNIIDTPTLLRPYAVNTLDVERPQERHHERQNWGCC